MDRPTLALRYLVWLCGRNLARTVGHPRWLGATPAVSLVLHTWTQALRTHLHVHALITCGGLDEAGQWHTPSRGRGFFFPVHAASRVFRAKSLEALDAARRSGQPPDDPEASPAAWGKQHVLPRGFKRIRHYGLLAGARLAAARTARRPPEPQPLAIEAAEAFLVRVSGHDPCRCPHCASGRWRRIGVIAPTPRCRDGPS